MLISKTPLRISFIGGGTDNLINQKFEGNVISTTINKFIYIGLNQKFDKNFRFSYSRTENVKEVKLVYIASNHATHSEYAINYLANDTEVFIEKPIAVNYDQLNALDSARSKSKKEIYSGFNRPNSPAIKSLKEASEKLNSPFSLSCFVIGVNSIVDCPLVVVLQEKQNACPSE